MTTPKDKSASAREGSERDIIPKRYQHAAAIAVLILGLVVFFNQIIFGGKTILAEDSIASHSFDTYLKDANEQGIFPLWNPYIFCGMPGYGSLSVTGDRWYDLSALVAKRTIAVVGSVLNGTVGWVVVYYMIFAVGMYVFAYSKVQHKVIATVVALAATFSTAIIIWIAIGHNTKVMVMAFFPLIFYTVEQLRQRFSLRDALLLTVFVHFALTESHVQMIFYIYLSLLVYGVFFLIRSVLKKEDWKGVVRTAAIFTVATGLAFAMDSDRYLSVLEYNPYSIRGSNPITQTTAGTNSKTVKGGLDYNYATAWSLSPGEMITFVVPSWYGFGITEFRGSLTNNQLARASTYAGPQPFAHNPPYMGVVVLVFAAIGFWRNRTDPFIQYLGVLIVFSLFVAFGKELSIVYDLMYNYFPAFNKFRVPSMILVLVQVFLPLLAGYGVLSLIKLRNGKNGVQSVKKWFQIVAGSTVGIAAVLLVAYESLLSRQMIQNMLGSFFGFGVPKDRIVEQVFTRIPANVIQEVTGHVVSMVKSDIVIGALCLLAAAGAVYLYTKKTLSLTIFSAIFTVAIVADLWHVGYKPMHLQPQQDLQRYFAPTDYVEFLHKDTTAYRVLQFVNGELQYDNTLAYWRIQNAYGYQAAKIRAYQDMLDVVGGKNPLLWNLMNVKYIISNQPDTLAPLLQVFSGAQSSVYYNTDVLPRAYFVDGYEVAAGKKILDNIAAKAFDPRKVAYLMEDPALKIEPPQAGARAEVVRVGIQDLEVNVAATGNNLLVLSETYYPEGWKAYIDGSPADIYRVNYLFRGVVVPAGEHTLTMVFEPDGFALGKNLSLAVNVFVLAALGVVVVMQARKKNSLTISSE
ncbi:MAG: YfhO family protein [Ignavibacteriae bacterium]|nr:YfhO family protein [Ignavibacteriota bacterium]